MDDEIIFLRKARDSLKASQTLLNTGIYNDAVSRAYYASFQMACVALHHFGIIDINQARDYNHKAIKSRFSKLLKEGRVHPTEIKGYLQNLLEKRMIADYEPNATIPLEKAKEMIEKATYFCQIIESSLIK